MRKIRKRRGLLGLIPIAAVALVLSSAAPAGAVHVPPETGAGSGTGGFTEFNTANAGLPEAIVCNEVVSPLPVLELWNEGTYTATDLTKPPPQQKSTYTGATHVSWSATQRYWINPEGTFQDSECTIAAFPGPTDSGILAPEGLGEGVDGTIHVENIPGPAGAGSLPGSVNCSGEADYGRQAGQAGMIIAHSVTCTVAQTGLPANLNFSNVSTNNTLTFEGTQQPCLPPFGLPCVFVPDPPVHNWTVGTEWVGTYTQN